MYQPPCPPSPIPLCVGSPASRICALPTTPPRGCEVPIHTFGIRTPGGNPPLPPWKINCRERLARKGASSSSACHWGRLVICPCLPPLPPPPRNQAAKLTGTVVPARTEREGGRDGGPGVKRRWPVESRLLISTHHEGMLPVSLGIYDTGVAGIDGLSGSSGKPPRPPLWIPAARFVSKACRPRSVFLPARWYGMTRGVVPICNCYARPFLNHSFLCSWVAAAQGSRIYILSSGDAVTPA